jgi:hypothetical protein
MAHARKLRSLALGLTKRQELVVRVSLGATPRRLLILAFNEALVVAAAGAVLGVAIAYGVVRLVVSFASTQLPRADAIEVNGVTLAFAVAPAVVGHRGWRGGRYALPRADIHSADGLPAAGAVRGRTAVLAVGTAGDPIGLAPAIRRAGDRRCGRVRHLRPCGASMATRRSHLRVHA